LRSAHRNLRHCAICSPEIETPERGCQPQRASHIPDPKEFAQILPIFLPFSKMDAVESAASEENG